MLNGFNGQPNQHWLNNIMTYDDTRLRTILQYGIKWETDIDKQLY